MLIFPQLQTGGVVQQVRRIKRSRVVDVARADGDRTRYLDPRGDTISWTLQFDNLSGEEWGAIEGLFRECQGRFRSFVFIDPLGNMLSHSEALTESVWSPDPYVDVADSQADAWEGQSGSRMLNTGQQDGSISQVVPVTAALQYTLSAFLRGSGTGSVELFIEGAGTQRRTSTQVSTQWKRHSLTAGLGLDSPDCRFGVSIPAGYAIDCCGFQAEAQPSPSAYKPTLKGGVYLETRFDTDTLSVESRSPGCFTTALQLISRGN